ncbi:MAG: hypothetical protein LPH21_00140 [Shewanella sp.]|nr:hypothetical protein [Shewanella sp.]MCF1429408.1 hypothetical protein [Shewanella sp.]MCF1456020.1 hypothetical protein [Shewanella sp.]
MFASQLKSFVLIATLSFTAAMATSNEVQAAELSDITGQIEQVIASQTQQLLQSARQELMLSLRMQVAEAIDELNTQIADTQVQSEKDDTVLLISQKPE